MLGMRLRPLARGILPGLLLPVLPACSIKKMAINSLGNALAEAGDTYASEEDPELVAGAIPFGLKTIESLLAEAPRHEGLLYAAASGFTQYAYGFVEQQADFLEDEDWEESVHQKERAKKLYLRARDYGLRGLELEFEGFRERLREDPEAALAKAEREHVPMLYWTAAAWAAATSLSIDDSELTADQFQFEAMMRRALELDETWEYGSIHDFFLSFEGSRAGAAGGSLEAAREHFERAMSLSRNLRAFPLVSLAETVSVAEQDREEFESLLEQALALDVDELPAVRLANLIAQKRARWLLGRTEERFIE
jgi:predicted anti-sigma-YlaC factor YlaD